MDEFDSTSSEGTRATVSDGREDLWICGASLHDFNPKQILCNCSVSDEAYVPQPFPEHLIDPLEWTHVLAIMSTCALPEAIQLCDSDDYDIVPIRMVQPMGNRGFLDDFFYENNPTAMHLDEVLVEELTPDTANEANKEDELHSDDDMPDSTLFLMETSAKWFAPILYILTTGHIARDSLDFNSWKPFKLIFGRLYRQGQDGVFRIIPNLDQYDEILEYAHVGIGRIHVSATALVQRVTQDGQWWPTLHADAIEFVRNCSICQNHKPIQYITLYQISTMPNWSRCIVQYLKQGYSDRTMPRHRKRGIEVEASNYTLIESQVYKRGKDGKLRMCVCELDYLKILTHAHVGVGGGHFFGDTTAKLIKWPSLWWPTLHLDVEEYVKCYDECQRTKPPITGDDMPLQPMLSTCAFSKWGIDFASPIKPPSCHTHAEYIIVATEYLTKWVEAKATTKNDVRTTTKFLYEYVFTRYGFPSEIVSDQGTHFVNEVIEFLLHEFMVIHKRSAPYHPQTNGHAQSTNKTLCTTLTKVVEGNRHDWEQKLHSVLWAYRTAYKTSMGTTPFELAFGLDAILPIEFLVPTLRVAKQLDWAGHELSHRIDDLEKLDETCLLAFMGINAEKRRQKQWFGQHVKVGKFKKGDLVLLYTLKKHKCKLKK